MRLQALKSRLLGFRTHADSVLEMNTDKTSQVVVAVLGNTASPSPSGDGVGRTLTGRGAA